jgi:DNA-binding GntR family transcriptional regulator
MKVAVLVQLGKPEYADRMATSSRFQTQIADALRAEIAAGQLKSRDKLPSIRELTDRFGVASETVRKALAVLADEGLIQPNSTRGYFVSDDAERAATSPDSRLDDLAQQVVELTERVAALEAGRSEKSGS